MKQLFTFTIPAKICPKKHIHDPPLVRTLSSIQVTLNMRRIHAKPHTPPMTGAIPTYRYQHVYSGQQESEDRNAELTNGQTNEESLTVGAILTTPSILTNATSVIPRSYKNGSSLELEFEFCVTL